MTLTAARYKMADLTGMLIPIHIPAETKAVVKLSIVDADVDVMSVLIANGGWRQSDPHTMVAWCATPAELEARREGLDIHFDNTGKAR